MVSVTIAIYAILGFMLMVWVTSSEDFEESIQEAFPDGVNTIGSYANLFLSYIYVTVVWPYILYAALQGETSDVE